MYDFKDDIYYKVYRQQLYPTVGADELITECEFFSEAFDYIINLQEELVLKAHEMNTLEEEYWTCRRLYDKEGHLLGTITSERGSALVDTGRVLVFVLDKINDTLVAYFIDEVD